MSEKNDPDPDSTVSIESLIGIPLQLVVERWRSFPPFKQIDDDLIARAPAIFEATGMLISHPELDRLQAAVAERDERALGGLVQLDQHLGMACGALLERCRRWKTEGEWTALRHEAGLAARLAVGLDALRAQALFLLAAARRALNDLRGTIDAYRQAIEAASIVNDEHLLAVSHDNLGNALKDIGSFDEALDHYRKALACENDPTGRRIIHSNLADGLIQVGELHSAAHELEEAVRELERGGTGGRELAIALDNAAVPISRLGEHAAALELLERARGLFETEDLAGRAANALSRSVVQGNMGDTQSAAESFSEAHQLAFEDARRRIDIEHYRQGFKASRSTQLPAGDDAYRMFLQGLAAKERDAWQTAFNLWQSASQRAWNAGDKAFALRVDANAAALMADIGQVDRAIAIALQVRQQASELGLARPELMVIGTLGSLGASGADIRDPLGPLGAFASAATLLEVHSRLIAETDITPDEAKVETYDPGTFDNGLAIQAEGHHADVLAAKYYRLAVDKAREVEGWFQLANRLAGLRAVLARIGEVEEADAAADDLEKLLSNKSLSDRGRLVVHRALGFHFADRDRTAAIDHFRQACALLEDLSRRVAPGIARAGVARQLEDIYRTLARLLRESGDDRASFEALQGEKGRRLIYALAARFGTDGKIEDAPPTCGEVMGMLERMGSDPPTMLVDLALEKGGLTAYLVGGGDVRSIHIDGETNELATGESGDVIERETRLVELCLRNSLLRELADAVTNAVAEGSRLLLAPDRVLHNLPLHIIPVNGRPWCELFSIGYVAAAGAMRFAPDRRPVVGRSLVAGDSRGDLPHAAAECREVATILGSEPLLGAECTRAALEERLQSGEFDVVHLALHGRGDGQRGGRASLLLADGKGGTEWVAFDEIAALPWHAEIVVFSGCSTAVAGPRQGHELVGIARAAAERGAAAVIACLWPVEDEAARIFMTKLYSELAARRATGPVDLRVVFDEARRAVRAGFRASTGAVRRDGRTLRPREAPATPQSDPAVVDALGWASFILLGDPILG